MLRMMVGRVADAIRCGLVRNTQSCVAEEFGMRKKMTVEMFNKEFGVTPLYHVDADLLRMHSGSEVLGYIVTMGDGKAFSYAFIYRTKGRLMRGFVNGRHVPVEKALTIISSANFKKKTINQSVMNEIFLHNT